MTPRCCRDPVSKIRVAGIDVGLRGLEGLLERLYTEGWSPEDAQIDTVILQGLRDAGNYVPPPAAAAHVDAVKEMLRKRVEANQAGRP